MQSHHVSSPLLSLDFPYLLLITLVSSPPLLMNPQVELHNQVIACVLVHSLAVAIAAGSSSFHLFATSGASGSSGLGAPRRAWMDRRIVRICKAGDQLPASSDVS